MEKGNCYEGKNKQKSTLYYDENTKIINVNRDIPTTNKFKRFCEQNKVYFETVLMCKSWNNCQ